jgi:hypothetical protein
MRAILTTAYRMRRAQRVSQELSCLILRYMLSSSGDHSARQMLRHTVATLAYRAGKTLRGAPASFARFESAASTRRPVEILAHMGDLFDWAAALAEGRHEWHNSTPLPWEDEVRRFFATLARFDAVLASNQPLGFSAERLFQGPVADALTHVGQIALLRRMAGMPVLGENYFRADIAAGCVGLEQAAAKVEFE